MNIEGKKILYLITQSHYGGAQKYVLQLAKHFKPGNEIAIAIGEAQHQDLRFLEEARSFGVEPTIVGSLIRDISLIKAFEALLEIRELLYKLRPDLLHINSSMAGAIGSCAAWLYNLDPLNKPIRVIYTAHGFVFNEPMSAWRKRFYIFIEKISAGWKHAIITVSQYDKQQGITQGITGERKLTVIHTGIDPAYSFLSRAAAREKLAIPHDSFAVGTIASLYPTKGITYLIDAAEEIASSNQDIRFYILGDGPLFHELTKKATNLKARDTVHFKGLTPEAARYIKAFDIFVLPSLKEGFPYVLLEAGLAGLPIIASRVGGIPEMIQHQENGLLVAAGNAEDLEAAIRTLHNEANLRALYGSSVQQKIQREFTLSRMLTETGRVYSKFYSKTNPS